MQHGIGLARTIEAQCLKSIQPMIDKLQPRMLPGDVQARWLAEVSERMGNRTELDGFRARSDNERNSILAQLSP